jgi:hypothetical protein
MPSDADPAQSGGGEASSVAGEIPLCPDLLHHVELEPILLLDLLHQQMLQPVLLLNRALVYKKVYDNRKLAQMVQFGGHC